MFLIGISGGTGSGKSTLANLIVKHNKNIGIINQDSYYKNFYYLDFKKRSLINYDDPKSFDFKLLEKNLLKLKKQKKISEPVYSYKSHKRLKKNKIIFPKNILILEGLHIFYKKSILDLIDLRIYLKVSEKVRLKRRIKRDMAERRRSRFEVESRFLSMCQPMHIKYTEPFQNKADFILKEDEIKIKKVLNLISKKINIDNYQKNIIQ